MIDIEIWKEIFSSIKNNKLRTFLTGISVSLGIFILVILLGLGNGLKNGVLAQFGHGSINTFYFWTGVTDLPYQGMPKGRRITFEMEDYENIKKLPEVESITAKYSAGNMKVVYQGERGSYSVQGCHPALQKIEGYLMSEGRFINSSDIVAKRKVVVIGSSVKDELFKRVDPVGKYMVINDIAFQIIGVYEQEGSTRNLDIYMPMSTVRAVFLGGSNVIHSIQLSTIAVHSEFENKIIENKIRNAIAERHHFDPNDNKAVGCYGVYDDYSQVNMMFMGIGVFIWIIGFGTLIAGIVGVSNVMLIMIKERTKEIGIRRALGATPRSIIRMILMEAVVITALFGYMGMLFGVFLLELVNFMLTHQMVQDLFIKNPGIDPGIAIKATLLLVLSGALAGYFPAKNAVKQKPIDAIRAE